MRVQRSRIKFHFAFRFIRVQQCFLDAELLRVRFFLLRGFCPVVRIVRDTHQDFPRRHHLQHLPQVLHKPILRRDRPRRRRQPMLVVIHQDNRVGFLAEEFVVVRIVPRRQRDHQLQPDGMQRRRKLFDKFLEILLACVRHFLEIHYDPGLFCRHRVLRHVRNQPTARIGACQQFRHLFHPPHRAVVIVQQAHHRKFHGRVQGAHPLVQLVLLQSGYHFAGRGLHCLIPLVVHHSDRAIRGHRVQLFRHQQVNVFVVFFQRGQAIRIPADEKRRAQRVIRRGNLSDIRYPLVPAFSLHHWLQQFLLHRVIDRPCVRKQCRWQFHASRDGQKKIDQQQRQQPAADFQDAARPPPPDFL